jgi:hypothetical protein
MRCPHCDKEIGGPIVGPKRLRCPECNESLVQLDLVFNARELRAFNAVIARAMDDRKFYEKLLADPPSILEEHGISQETISHLTGVMSDLGVPTVAACVTDPRSWLPEIESPQD